jgi:hypothetical protein
VCVACVALCDAPDASNDLSTANNSDESGEPTIIGKKSYAMLWIIFPLTINNNSIAFTS